MPRLFRRFRSFSLSCAAIFNRMSTRFSSRLSCAERDLPRAPRAPTTRGLAPSTNEPSSAEDTRKDCSCFFFRKTSKSVFFRSSSCRAVAVAFFFFAPFFAPFFLLIPSFSSIFWMRPFGFSRTKSSLFSFKSSATSGEYSVTYPSHRERKRNLPTPPLPPIIL